MVMSNTSEDNITLSPINNFEFTEPSLLDYQNEEEKNTSINEKYSSTFKNEKKVFDDNILEEEKIIAFNIIAKRSSENENNLIKTEKQKDSSGLYSFEDIKNFLLYNNNNSFKKILENFIKDSTIEQAEKDLKFIQRKRKRRNTKNEDNIEIKIKYDQGRKLKSDISERKHNKMKDDNIVLKIKTKIFKEILNFLNNILDINHEENNKKKLRQLDYNLTKQMKRDTNLKLLNMTLKDIFSQEISSKIKTAKSNSNKLLIQKIMNEKKDKEIIMFSFNLQLREWINLFTMKNKIENFKNLSMKSHNEINQKFPKVDILLNDILNENKNNKKYLSYFIFYLYNFENYFLSKESRRSKFEIRK